jgi:hypothetical protein
MDMFQLPAPINKQITDFHSIYMSNRPISAYTTEDVLFCLALSVWVSLLFIC